MKILNIDPEGFSKSARTIYKRLGKYEEKKLTRKQLIDEIINYDVLVLRYSHFIDHEVIRKAKNLKVIATNLTGTDHINSRAIEKASIKLISLQNQSEFLHGVNASAELTWALVLSLFRKIPWACSAVLSGQWNRNEYIGRELSGKSIGIVGLGRNGNKIARYAIAFGMNVCAFDPVPRQVEHIRMFESLDKLLPVVDVVSIHVPLTKETMGMFNRDSLRLMSKGSFLINTSRGEIIDENALVEALASDHLAGAASDVISNELGIEDPIDNVLIRYARSHDNLIITPHIGGVTFESWEKTETFIAEAVEKYLLNKNPE